LRSKTPPLPNPVESHVFEIFKHGAPAAGCAHACDGYLFERARRIPPAGEFSGTSGEGGGGHNIARFLQRANDWHNNGNTRRGIICTRSHFCGRTGSPAIPSQRLHHRRGFSHAMTRVLLEAARESSSHPRGTTTGEMLISRRGSVGSDTRRNRDLDADPHCARDAFASDDDDGAGSRPGVMKLHQTCTVTRTDATCRY